MTEPAETVRSIAPLAAVLGAIALLAGAGADPGSGPSTDQPAAARSSPAPEASSPALLPSASSTPTGTSSTTDASGATASASRPYTTETVRGRVVWLEDALKRGFGVTTEPAAAEKTVVLETTEGKLWPLVPDTRGRAFAVDERLRDIELQLLVRRYEDAPMLQVITVYRPQEDGLYEIDYWCDICSIPMVILKSCECCQGPTRLRERPVKADSAGG